MRFYNGRVLEERKRSVGDVLMFQTAEKGRGNRVVIAPVYLLALES